MRSSCTIRKCQWASLENKIENGYEELLYKILEFDHNPFGSMSSTTALKTEWYDKNDFIFKSKLLATDLTGQKAGGKEVTKL